LEYYAIPKRIHFGELFEDCNNERMYRKSLIGGVQGFKPMSTTGPHKIYLSYDTPQLDTVNELGLKHICNYARNLTDSVLIFNSGVVGLYNQGWEYFPKHKIYIKPLDMLRVSTTTGQCVDFANLLTYFSNAIGIHANTCVITNGDYFGVDTTLLYFWYCTKSGEDAVLWSNELKTCNGVNDYWVFLYHAVSRMGFYLGDPVFNIMTLDSEYKQWWRYYLNPLPSGAPPYNYSHVEPPNITPNYINWPRFCGKYPISKTLFRFDSYFRHP
jgi:hypothetical protein